MSVEDFLNRVEATGLISTALMGELRVRVSESNRRMRPEMIAKLLVDRGELTAAQARKLVMDSVAGAADAEEDILTGEPMDEADESPNDDLSLVANDDVPNPTQASPGSNDDLELVLEDDTPEAILIEDEVEEVDDTPVATLDTEELEAEGLRDLLDEPLTAEDSDDGGIVELSDQGTRLRRRGSIFSRLFGSGGGKSGPRTNRWDSPLILMGGGGLILLAGIGFAIFALLYNENVDEIFDKAESAYQSQSYPDAIKHYEHLSTKYPQDKNASMSRVRAELARLRQFTDGGSPDWSGALSQSQQGLPKITSEEAMPNVRAELAKLLPDITDGLVKQSHETDELPAKKSNLALAEEALKLVHDPVYLPTSVKQTQELRIDDIEAQMDVVRRDIERAEALAATTEKIRSAANDGRVVEAYRFRDDLVAKYPILTGNPTLNDALSSVVAKELKAVQVGESDLKPTSEDHPRVSSIQLVLSDRRGKSTSGVDRRVFPVLARGAVYGLNAADGKVLWRRFVGYGTAEFPRVVADQSQDFLLVDGLHGEVQRVGASDGKLKWRVACPMPIAQPLLAGNRAFVCCGSEEESRLLAIDVESGTVQKEVRFPVGCIHSPGLLADGKELAQLGTHSSIYILDAESLACKSVIPSGHRRGRVATSPVALGELLLVAENVGTKGSQLQRYSKTGDTSWARAGTPLELTGAVVSTPLVTGRRLMTATDLGEVKVFETPLNSQELREIANVAAGGEALGRSFAQFAGSQLWIADQKLTRYQLQATRGQLVTEWVRDERDIFQNPIYRFGNNVFTVRRREGMLGVTVAAHSTSDGKGDPIWETDLAVPNHPLVGSAGSVYTVTDNGAMFPVDAPAVAAGISDRRKSRVDPRLLPNAFSHWFRLNADEYVFAGPAPNSHYIFANLKSGSLSRQPLRIDADVASTELVPFAGSVLAACETGPIHCLDPGSGKQETSPFVPKIAPGTQIAWLPPAELAGSQFMAADRSGQVYVIARRGKELTAAREGQIPGPLVAGLAGVGQVGFAVSSSAGTDELIAIKSDLNIANTWPLKNGVAWGPKRIGNLVLVLDGAHMLYALDEQATLKWSAQLDGPLAGEPLSLNSQFLVTTTKGMISLLDASGQLIGKKQLAEPLGGSPVSYKGRLLVVGWDGTLFLVEVPK